MKVSFIVLLSSLTFLSAQNYSTRTQYDTLLFQDGEVVIGELKIMKEESLEFYDSYEQTTLEIPKSTIDNIHLVNGRVMSFYGIIEKGAEDNNKSVSDTIPLMVKKSLYNGEDNSSDSYMLLGTTIGIVLVVFLFIGAAASDLTK